MTNPSKKPIRKDVLLDSDILIKLVLGNKKVDSETKLLDLKTTYISQVSVLELFHNADAKSFKAFEKLLTLIKQIPISEELGNIGLSLLKGYPKKLKAADALIAATARKYGLQLYTNNRKDFEGIGQISLYVPKTHTFPL